MEVIKNLFLHSKRQDLATKQHNRLLELEERGQILRKKFSFLLILVKHSRKSGPIARKHSCFK